MNKLQQWYCRFRYVLEKEKRKRYPRMRDTIHIPEKQGVPLIAHRGVSGLQTENTLPAFIAAGRRSYFGIETDVHRTKDGKFVVFHDDDLKRMAGLDLVVEETDFDTLQTVPLFETRFYKACGKAVDSLRIPTLSEYICVCKEYNKVAVLELKNHFEREDIARICTEIASLDWLDNTIFISFDFDNLVYVRELYPTQSVQFLTGEVADFTALFDKLQAHRFDWDVYHRVVNKALVDECHRRGIKVGVWTADEVSAVKRLIACGVDYITTDILE